MAKFAFSFQNIHLRNSLQRKLLAAGVQGFRGKCDGALLHLLVIIGIHEIPVDVANLSNGRDDLRFECNVSNLLVGLGNAQIAQVGAGSETGQQLLAEGHYHVRVQSWD